MKKQMNKKYFNNEQSDFDPYYGNRMSRDFYSYSPNQGKNEFQTPISNTRNYNGYDDFQSKFFLILLSAI